MLSARRTPVDVVIPPLSLAAYYEPPGGDYPLSSTGNWRCAAAPCWPWTAFRARGVFAVDNEDWLTGDLANYKNPTHLRSAAAQIFLLQAVAHGTHRLTKDNVAAQMALLRSRVLHYRVRDSAVPDIPAMVPEAHPHLRHLLTRQLGVFAEHADFLRRRFDGLDAGDLAFADGMAAKIATIAGDRLDRVCED